MDAQQGETVQPIRIGPMTLGELLDTAFLLFRRFFLRYYALALVPAALAFIILTTTRAALKLNIRQPAGPPDPQAMLAELLRPEVVAFWLLSVVVMIVSSALSGGAVTASVVAARQGRTASFGTAMRDALRMLPKLILADVVIWIIFGLIVTAFLVPVLVFVGVVVVWYQTARMLLIVALFITIPLVSFACVFALVFILRYRLFMPVMFAERTGVWPSLKRSRHLMITLSDKGLFTTRNHIVRVGIILLVLVMISVAIFALLTLVFGIVGVLVILARLGAGTPWTVVFRELGVWMGGGPMSVVFDAVFRLVAAVVPAFEAVCITVFYYEICARREGLDLHHAIDALEPEKPADG